MNHEVPQPTTAMRAPRGGQQRLLDAEVGGARPGLGLRRELGRHVRGGGVCGLHGARVLQRVLACVAAATAKR